MNDEEIQYEYFEFVSPYNILIVSNDGELLNVLCPFKVRAKVNFPEIQKDNLVWVQKVQTTKSNQDAFIINGDAYLVRWFQIFLGE